MEQYETPEAIAKLADPDPEFAEVRSEEIHTLSTENARC